MTLSRVSVASLIGTPIKFGRCFPVGLHRDRFLGITLDEGQAGVCDSDPGVTVHPGILAGELHLGRQGREVENQGPAERVFQS